MRPLSLYMEGFKTFAEPVTFDFTEHPEDGLCFVTGNNKVDPELGANGAGKSTVFDAALFGKTSRGLKASDVASWQIAGELQEKAERAIEEGKKAPSKKALTPSVTTRLTFENHSGDTCIINRRWNPNVLTLQVNDGDPKNVDQTELDALIGYNFDEFLQAAYFSQFQDLFLDMGSTERSALVAKVLSLDIWDKYADNAKKEADGLKDQVDEHRRQIERIRGQVEELEAQDLSTQIAEWDHAWEQELADITAELEAQRKQEPELEKSEADAKQARDEQAQKVADLEDELEDAVEAVLKPLDTEQAKKLAEVDERLEAQESKREAALRRMQAVIEKGAAESLAEVDDEIEKVEKAREAARSKADAVDHSEDLRELSRKEATLTGEIERIEADMDKVEARADKVEKLEGDCSACGQPITEEHVDHELDACEKELAALDEKAEQADTELTKVRKQIRKLEREAKAAEESQKAADAEFRTQLKDLRDRRADVEDENKQHARELLAGVEDKFRDALKALREERSALDKAGRVARQEAEQSIRDERRGQIKAEQEILGTLTEKARYVTSTLKDCRRAITDLEADLEDCKADKNPHRVQQEKNAKRLEALNDDREKQFAELEALVESEQASRYWVKGFKSVKLFAVSAALNELEAEVNNALDGLGLGGWSVEFDVDKENKNGNLSKGFFAFISGPDNLEPVKWEAWSGGESQRLRLAASLGLANMIRASKGLELPFEIWDEPSQWMSDSGITGLLDVLQRRARRLKRQIWLIDHRGLEHPFDSVICVEKTHSGSTIKNVTHEFAGAQ